jgi:Trypsin-co-occurring domain 1
MNYEVDVIDAKLEDGTVIRVEARVGGLERVGDKVFPFQEITNAVEGIASSFMKTIEKVKPKKASVEFGIEVTLESGQLTALLVKGTGTSNLKVTLEWGE